jgi:hypothetical protein
MSIVLIGCNMSTFNEIISGELHPLPTASPANVNPSIFRSLVSASSDCKLPCFMGLRPGETKRGDLEELLGRIPNAPFAPYYFDGGVAFNTILKEKSNGSVLASFKTNKGLLTAISMTLTHSNDWLPKNILLLPNLLNMLGDPDNVYISIAGPPLNFTMVVVYNRAGVMVRYRAYFKENVAHRLENTEDPFIVCLVPTFVDLVTLDLWLENPTSGNLVEAQLPFLREDESDIRPFWSIEKMAGINTQQFTNFFVKNPQGCLEAPSMKQLQTEGYVF